MPDLLYDDIALVFRDYSTAAILSIDKMPGFTGDNYGITASSGKFTLKTYPARRYKKVEYTGCLSHWGADAGLPTPRPVPNRHGMFGTIFKAGERCATLLTHAEGTVLHSGELGIEQLLSVAAIAALFKHTMALIPFKLRDQRKVLAGLAGSYANRRQSILARAVRLSTPREYVEPIQTCLAAKQQLIARVKPWLQDDRTWKGAVVHGDFHNENIIFHNGCATWVIDLEETRLGWDGEDVVTFAILASGQAEISGAALERIAPLIHSFRVLVGVGRQDISASIHATLMRLAASTRLEEWALTDTSGVAIALVCRDATRFESILASIEDIHEVWAWS